MNKGECKTRKTVTIQSRVEIAPHYDAWMQGARYGTVIALSRKDIQTVATVKLDKRRELFRCRVVDLKLL